MSKTLLNETMKLSVEQLKEMALKLNADFREGTDSAFEAVLAALEAKMSTSDFVGFCDSF